MGEGTTLIDRILKMHMPKTPYELDLEVKDRKPSVIPKVGDMVKFKSKAWYDKWKGPDGLVNLDLFFNGGMTEYCGCIAPVIRVDDDDTFRIKDCTYWFPLQAVEEVYPVVPAIHPSGSEVVLSQYAIDKLTQSIPALSCKCDASLFECTVPPSCSSSDTQPKRPEQTKLQLIKSRPLLKLKKL